MAVIVGVLIVFAVLFFFWGWPGGDGRGSAIFADCLRIGVGPRRLIRAFRPLFPIIVGVWGTAVMKTAISELLALVDSLVPDDFTTRRNGVLVRFVPIEAVGRRHDWTHLEAVVMVGEDDISRRHSRPSFVRRPVDDIGHGIQCQQRNYAIGRLIQACVT